MLLLQLICLLCDPEISKTKTANQNVSAHEPRLTKTQNSINNQQHKQANKFNAGEMECILKLEKKNCF